MEKEKTNRPYDSLLKTYSIKEIVKILSEIDQKIVSLHDCSAEDFLKFNKYMQQYYKQAKLIAQNADEVFTIVAASDYRSFFTDLEQFHSNLKNTSRNFATQIDDNLANLKEIQIGFDKLFVPFKNFKQNIISIKYLEANVLLKHKYSISKEKSTKETFRIETLLENLNRSYLEIRKDIEAIKEATKQLIFKLKEIKELRLFSLQNILDEMSSAMSFLLEKHKEATLQVPRLKDKTANYFESISKIITKLQYHDIIRQKMEHIQQSHKDIIEELHQIEQGGEEEAIRQKRAECFLKIKDIAGLQVAQLMHTNKQYESAIETITRKMLEVGQEMNSVSDLCFRVATFTDNPNQTHFEAISRKLAAALQFLDSFASQNDLQIQENIQAISQHAQAVKQKIQTLYTTDEKIQQYIAALQETFADNSAAPDKLAERLNHTASDIHTITSNIRQHFDKLCQLTQNLPASIENANPQNPESGFEKLAPTTRRIAQILEQFEKNNRRLSLLLHENNQMAVQIAGEIKDIVLEVKYYDFFEKVIEEIVGQLNEVSQKLDKSIEKEDKSLLNKHLHLMKNKYTVGSEHDVHEKVLNNDDFELFDDKNDQEELEDNIEFF